MSLMTKRQMRRCLQENGFRSFQFTTPHGFGFAGTLVDRTGRVRLINEPGARETRACFDVWIGKRWVELRAVPVSDIDIRSLQGWMQSVVTEYRKRSRKEEREHDIQALKVAREVLARYKRSTGAVNTLLNELER